MMSAEKILKKATHANVVARSQKAWMVKNGSVTLAILRQESKTSPAGAKMKQKNNVSAGKRNTIGVLDFVYAFSAMVKDQADEAHILSLADALSKSALAGLGCLAHECHILEQKYQEEMIRKAENLIIEGFGSTEISGETWTAFLLRLLDIQLHKPLRKNGLPKKNGWIRDKNLRNHLEDCRNILYSLSLAFSDDDDSEDFEAIKLGDKASGIYISS